MLRYDLVRSSYSCVLNYMHSQWVNRSAFHFGGLGTKTDHRSQSQPQLVFSTGECHTNMIRSENAVAALASLCGKSDRGVLVTRNIIKGNVLRRKIDGSYDIVAIPPWVEAQHAADKGSLAWLCMNLEYQFSMKHREWVSPPLETKRSCTDVRIRTSTSTARPPTILSAATSPSVSKPNSTTISYVTSSRNTLGSPLRLRQNLLSLPLFPVPPLPVPQQ